MTMVVPDALLPRSVNTNLTQVCGIDALILWLSGEALLPWRQALAQREGSIIPPVNEPPE